MYGIIFIGQVDMRVPEVIRIAPFPLYNTFEDVWNFVQMLRDVILLLSS